MDSVADLARILRLPGFLNHKDRRNPKPVRSLMSDGPTYTLAEIEALLPEGPPERTAQARPRPKASLGKLAVIPAAAGMTNADWVHLAVSIENAPPVKQARARFDAIWGGHRPDMDDRSGSAYDLALANLLALMGWTREEIKPVLVERRRVAVKEGREEPNPKPNSYYALTLSKVQTDEDADGEQADEKVAGDGEEPPRRAETRKDQNARIEAAVMAQISQFVDSQRLIYWLDRYYEHRGIWQVQSPRVIEKRLRDAAAAALKVRHAIVSISFTNAWMKALEMAVQPPCEDTAVLLEVNRWGSYNLDTGESVEGTAFANAVISIDKEGHILTRQPSLREFFALARPYDYPSKDPGRPALFDAWMQEKFPDAGTRQALWECIGGTVLQLMAGDEKVPFLKGPGGTGKGTLARVIDALMGLGQTWEVASPSRLVTSQFALSQAPWSSVLRITDMPAMPSREGAARDAFIAGMGILKSMSGSDGVAVEKKNQDQTSAKTNLSVWVDTNHAVTQAITGDDSTAWERRVILIPTTQRTPDHRQQRRFFEKFLPELPKIAWAAVQAYAATVTRGFTQSLEMVEAVEAERGDLGVAQRKALTEQTKAYIASLPKGAAFKATREDLRDGLRAALGDVPPDEKTVKELYSGIRKLPGVRETRSGSDRGFYGIGLPGDGSAARLQETPQETPQETLKDVQERAPVCPEASQGPASAPAAEPSCGPSQMPEKSMKPDKPGFIGPYDVTTPPGTRQADKSGRYIPEH